MMNEYAEFIIVYGEGLYHPKAYRELYRAIQTHSRFHTLTTLTDCKGIYAVARWNIEDTVAHVIDVVIRPDKRSKQTLKRLIDTSKKKFSYLTHIRFERGKKVNKNMRLIKLDKLKEK